METLQPRSRISRILCYCMFLAALSAPSFAHAAAGAGGIVQGSMDLPGGHYHPGVPDIKVYVRNTNTQMESVHVATDSVGNFVIPNQPAGAYQFCWEEHDGLAAGCGYATRGGGPNHDTLDIIDHVSTRWISGQVAPKTNAIAIRGVISLPGGPSAAKYDFATPNQAVCRHSDPFFAVDVTADVALYDSAGTKLLAKGRANTAGAYILAFVPTTPVPTSYQLKVSCASNAATVPVMGIGGPGTYVKDVTLSANQPPVIDQLRALVNGKAVQGAPAGTRVQVKVKAQDSDHDRLSYQWQATAGTVNPTSGATINWTLPATGKGLYSLYVLVSDNRGGYTSQRITISTDSDTIVTADRPDPPTPIAAHVPTAELLPEFDRFFTYRGNDTRKSACEYYRVLHAVSGCDANGNPQGGITFSDWKARNGLADTPANGLAPGELTAAFRNVADLNLVRDHHGRKVGPNHVAYYVCNHAQKEGDNLPTYNLVACVAMEYSVIAGVNNNLPFTQFYSFGPTGELSLSTNLEGRGEKFVPSSCVPCHGGDGYFNHFPDQGASGRDANIGAYFEPFDLDNFAFSSLPGFTREDQETAVRELNLLLKQTDPTPATVQLIDGWYPNGQGKQQSTFLPPGWDPNQDASLPTLQNGAPFNTHDLYRKVVKPYCRLCHLTMGTKLGLDFNRYQALPANDPTTAPDDRVGDFMEGNSDLFSDLNDMGTSNSLHTANTVCEQFSSSFHIPPSDHFFDNTNHLAFGMPNAAQPFKHFWQDAPAVKVLGKFLEYVGENADACKELCAFDVSAHVQTTRGEVQPGAVTGRYLQKVTIVNTSQNPIAGPLSLALANLTGGVTVVGATGQTSCGVSGVGNPYLNLKAGAGNVLKPGKKTTVELEFTAPANTPIRYDAYVLAGPHPR